MKKILGLDISSKTIGWALLSDKKELLKYGHLKPPSKKKSKDNLSLRLDFAFEGINNLVSDLSPDIVVIEDYSKKFTRGRSSANTIIVLACFNEVCGLAIYKKTKNKPERIPVTTLRSLVKKKYNMEISDKESVFKFCKNNFKNYLPKINRNGKVREESYDEADAIIVSLGYMLKYEI